VLAVSHSDYLIAINIIATHTQDGNTALTGAASNGHTECVRLLLEGGAKGVENQVRGHICEPVSE
jgi:ankyrin repeat protein